MLVSVWKEGNLSNPISFERWLPSLKRLTGLNHFGTVPTVFLVSVVLCNLKTDFEIIHPVLKNFLLCKFLVVNLSESWRVRVRDAETYFPNWVSRWELPHSHELVNMRVMEIVTEMGFRPDVSSEPHKHFCVNICWMVILRDMGLAAVVEAGVLQAGVLGGTSTTSTSQQ